MRNLIFSCHLRPEEFLLERAIFSALSGMSVIGGYFAKVGLRYRSGFGTAMCIASPIGDRQTRNSWWSEWSLV